MEKQCLPLQIAPILFCFLITADWACTGWEDWGQLPAVQLTGAMVAARQPQEQPQPGARTLPTVLVAPWPGVGSPGAGPGELGHPWAQLLQPV